MIINGMQTAVIIATPQHIGDLPMRANRNAVTYKLPSTFVDAHKSMLDAVDWAKASRVEVEFEGQTVAIEAVAGRGGVVVRPATIKAANLIRRRANELGQEPTEDAEEALAKRNPSPDKQD